jgi:neutral ceramidase
MRNKIIKWFFIACLIVAVLLISLFAPIDRTPLKEQSFYKVMQEELKEFSPQKFPSHGRLKIGWSSFNITPSSSMPMAGFTPRSHFDQVHDSLYTRIVAIDNGNATCYLISMDLLLFPPALKRLIEEKLTARGRANDFVYYSVSHTHNGIGGWDTSIMGKFVLGGYSEAWINTTAELVVAHMTLANESSIPSKLSYWETDAKECVSNRLAPRLGSFDSKLRGLRFDRDDSTKGILFTYAAHAANVSKKSLVLSGDYPSATLAKLNDEGWDFGMYMAGMVGSHRLDMDHLKVKDFAAIEKASSILAPRIMNAMPETPLDSLTISFGRLPVPMGPSQMRVLKNWKVRDWAFQQLVGKLEAEITWMKLGNVLFLGTSCDFSGEISVDNLFDQIASDQGDRLIITSFNGSYSGYINKDEHYDTRKKEETMTMSWVGPYFGEYYAGIMKQLIEK